MKSQYQQFNASERWDKMIGKTNAGSGTQVFYLGTGTSFDVSNVPGYQNLTEDNFIVDCGSYSLNVSCSLGGSGSNNTSITKKYNPVTGILTLENTSVSASGGTNFSAVWEYGEGFSNRYVYGSASVTRNPQVWLCKGKIKQL